MLHDKYEIIKLIGSGSQTEVYLGLNTENNEHVAIKKLKTANVTEWKTFDLFERNIKILKNLNYKGIPYFVDSFSDDNSYYLIEQFIDGQNLKQSIDAGKFFTIDELYKIIKNILNILNYLHTLNPPVIHREIKPSNIIIDKEDNLFVIDFGAVQKDLNNSKSDYTVVGTAGYTPAEQFMGKTDKRSDLYSLGATIIHLLTHKHPNDIDVKDMKIDYKKYVDITDNFKSFIDKLIEPDIEKRFDSSLTALEYFIKHVENNKTILENNINLVEIKNNKPEIEKPKRKYGLFLPPTLLIASEIIPNISRFLNEITKEPMTVIAIIFIYVIWFIIYYGFFWIIKPVTKNVGNNKAQKKSNGQQSNESRYNNIFIDKNLNDCVVAELAKNNFKLNYKSVKTIKTIDLTDKNIEDLSGIERLSNLEELNISFNKIITIKHFKQLKKLRKLNISNNSIKSIKSINPIKELLFIEELDISSNQIEDIAALTNLSKLRIIIMNCNFIKSLTVSNFNIICYQII